MVEIIGSYAAHRRSPGEEPSVMSGCEILDPHVGGALIASASGPGFGATLLEAAQHITDVSEVFCYRLVDGGKPQALLSCSEHGDADRRADGYVARFYRNDPARWARRGAASGAFVKKVRASEIALSDYRALCFDRPRFAEKICFGWRGADEEIALSFYRRGGGVEGGASLLKLANVALTALVGASHRPVCAPAEANAVPRLERRLRQCFPTLSQREVEVCARTLGGHTAKRISSEFDLSLGTVLTYRQRAYSKLGVSTTSELLPMLLDCSIE